MFGRAAATLAVIGFLLAFGAQSAAADTQRQTAHCTGDPELPGVEFRCQQVAVRLVSGADIDEVMERSAPTATVIGLDNSGTWNLRVLPGEEPSVRDALREDPAVANVSLWYIGYLSGPDGVPDTATAAHSFEQVNMMFGFVMLAAAVLVRASFRAADVR